MPAPMNTDSRRKASADFHARRKAEGWRKVTVWLDPEAVAKVDALKAAAGSADDVHRQAIKDWRGPGAAEVDKAVESRAKAKPAPVKKAQPEKASAAPKVQLGPTARAPGSMLIEKRKR